MKKVIAAVASLLLVAGCTPKQEEVTITNRCTADVQVWVSSVAPPPGAVGRLVEAKTSRLLTYDPDEPIQQIWILDANSEWVEVGRDLDFSASSGESLTAEFSIPLAACPS